MDLTILKVICKDDLQVIAQVHIGYHELVLKCEIAYYEPQKKVFVRMPERMYGDQRKIRYCYWFTDELSEDFQKSALQAIYKKTGWNPEKIAKMHEKKKMEKKLKK